MLRGVRGATTADSNRKEDILTATQELLAGLMRENPIQTDDIGAIIFSSTPDLDATFPAAAARTLGWAEVPLFGTQEIDCPTGVPLCIRVLVLWNTETAQRGIRPVYMKGATALRPDIVAQAKKP